MRVIALLLSFALLGVVPAAHAGGRTNGSSESSSSESSSGESSSGESSSGESSSSGSTSSDSASTESGSSDTTSDDTSTSSADDTGTTSDTSGVVDDTTGSSCSCPTGDESITIDTPADQADVAAPFLVSVDVQPRCPCFDCSCAAEDFEYAQLFVAQLAYGGPCDASPCEWSVSPGFLGITEIRATAWYPSGQATTSIDVNVTSLDEGTTTDLPPDPTTAPPPESTDTTGYAGETPPAGGCGCAGAPAHRGAPVLLVVAAFVRRRRRP
jgi:MYXO-CTERM domain-containing protein